VKFFVILFIIHLYSSECAEHDGVDQIALRPACDELCPF